MNKSKFSIAMKALAVNSGIELTKDILNLYYETLKNFSDEQFDSGVKKTLLTWEYNRMPPIATIKKNIEQDGNVRLEDKAEIQVSLVLKTMKDHPYFIDARQMSEMTGKMEVKTIKNPPPVFEDPITQNLMTSRWPFDSWRENILVDEIKWWTKEFKEAYKSFSRESLNLMGQIEACDGIKKLLQ